MKQISRVLAVLAMAGTGPVAIAQTPTPTPPASPASPTVPTTPTPAPAQVDPGLAAPEKPAEPAVLQLTVDPPTLPEHRRPHAVELLKYEGAKLVHKVDCTDARRFIYAINWLPAVDNRTLYRRKESREWFSAEQFAAMDEAARAGLEQASADPYFFYYTRYGSPLAYARPIDILCKELGGGDSLRGKKILDFGFGTIGHLRLLASIGTNVTGIEVDPMLSALYSMPEDVGVIEGSGMQDKTPDGILRLLYGRWPAEADIVAGAGDGYDVFMSKNTLKRGYVHPEPPEGQKVNPRTQLNLGVDDEAFVSEVARIVRPGGVWFVYNICPKPAPEGQPYIPWADGRFPFDRALVEKHGFEVIAWDQDDTEAMREHAQLMAWDKKDKEGKGGMDLENDFVVHYTMLRKKESGQIIFQTPAPASRGKPASQ